MSTIVEDAGKLLLSLVPYLNAGIVTLIIDLAFERLGFKIAKREFKRKPLSSLFWGLCLILIGSIVALIIQTRLSGFEPFIIFLVLFAAYLALTQM
jgi:hypothetical protein